MSDSSNGMCGKTAACADKEFHLLVSRPSGGTAVLHIAGSFDAENFQLVDSSILQLLNKGISCIIMDFEKVSNISSAGATSILMALAETDRHGATLSICNVSETVMSRLDMMGLLQRVEKIAPCHNG